MYYMTGVEREIIDVFKPDHRLAESLAYQNVSVCLSVLEKQQTRRSAALTDFLRGEEIPNFSLLTCDTIRHDTKTNW